MPCACPFCTPSAGESAGGRAGASSAFLDRLGFQLYSAREFPPVEEQLKTLAALGYVSVEFGAGTVAEPERLKQLLDQNGLRSPSGHFDLEQLRHDPETLIARARLFDIHLVVISYLPPHARPPDAEGWLALGRELEGFAGQLAKENLQLAWHTHDFEFQKLPDGSFPLDRLFEAAPSLSWQPDIGWLTRAGQDPRAWLERYLDRVRSVHLKDVAADRNNGEGGWADLGYGTVDWASLLPLFAQIGDVPLDRRARQSRRLRPLRPPLARDGGGVAFHAAVALRHRRY